MNYKIKYDPSVDSSIIRNVIVASEPRFQSLGDWLPRLEASILREGVRNPVVLSAHKPEDGGITPRYGGSRIYVAQKYGLRIPAIIADFDDIFPCAEEIGFDIKKLGVILKISHNVFILNQLV
ncbi:MAG: hypothetical protein HC836_40710 [Richelia sp. RM2_1_2]|nr:hypothetical protein [Richelia sp. RM2_1_2]